MAAPNDLKVKGLLYQGSHLPVQTPQVGPGTATVDPKARVEGEEVATVTPSLGPAAASSPESPQHNYPHLHYPHLHYPHFHQPHLPAVHWNVHVHTFDSFHYPDFRLIWGATVCAAGGFWLQQVIIGWLSYELTHSAFLTTLAMGLDALPMLLAGPLAGVLVDSLDRRKLLALVFTYQALVTLGLFSIVVLVQPQTWHVFAFILLMGLSWAITDPTRISLISSSVPREHLVNAFALNSTAFSITRLVAPIVGGVLLAVGGVGPALLAEAGLQLGAVTAALFLRNRELPRPALGVHSAATRVVEGIRYVRAEPVILELFLLAIVPSVLVMPFVHGLMPVYAAEVFRVGPTGLGVLLAAIGAGATVGTVLLASLGSLKEKGHWAFLSAGVMALAMVAFSRAPWFGLALPLLMLLSAGTMIFFALNVALVQTRVKSELRGRVTGLYMVAWGLTPLGSLMAGILADRFGAPSATLAAAVAVSLALVVLAIKFKPVRSLQ